MGNEPETFKCGMGRSGTSFLAQQASSYGLVFKVRVSVLGVLFVARGPYYIGDRKRDPNLENYPFQDQACRGPVVLPSWNPSR